MNHPSVQVVGKPRFIRIMASYSMLLQSIFENHRCIFNLFYRMTNDEKNEMENHIKSLQECSKLLSSEGLIQLEEERNIEDENMDAKVA